MVALSPVNATFFGVSGYDTTLDDFSPAGTARFSELRRRTLAALDAAPVVDDVDRVTVASMRERLGLREELYAAGHDLASLNVMWSPLQAIREVFDLMPTDTPEQVTVIVARLHAVPDALDSLFAGLQRGWELGSAPAARQVLGCIEQCQNFASPTGFFATFRTVLQATSASDVTLGRDVDRAITVAADAFVTAAQRLRDEVLPRSPQRDAVGREHYALASRQALGARIDMDETYAWAVDELQRLCGHIHSVAARIAPGEGIAAAIAALDADPRYRLSDAQAALNWAQERADEAIAFLHGKHFDIPEPIRHIETKIAPTSNGGIYYTPPNENFSRPGTIWWSPPDDAEYFSSWRQIATIYHEGAPGHHLQMGYTRYLAGSLNRWRRFGCWTSGHAEGWATYAEQLMADLGYLDDPGYHIGLLKGQVWRTARVVLDVGFHCELPAPKSVGSGSWTYAKAREFLSRHTHLTNNALDFEITRYLGWPGQAASYKIGEQLWTQLREEERRRKGSAFELRAFHERALGVGGVGLDVLADALRPPTSPLEGPQPNVQ